MFLILIVLNHLCFLVAAGVCLLSFFFSFSFCDIDLRSTVSVLEAQFLYFTLFSVGDTKHMIIACS